ncbi:MAG TPA: adenylate/guanylate cyclase domain-containing protein [Flavisolibacter sp.]
MAQTRQLAAIMFTDIVGYTALMGEDEQRAFDILQQNRQLQKPLIEQYHGQWIKELGDGVLASFPNVTDAVLCAAEIQKACGGDHSYKLRIGIHLGEVVFEDGDVFGDGVNIASRLQALAPVGGIWISDMVHHNVYNKKEIRTRFVREETLKNVKDPVRIYEVITPDSPAWDEPDQPGSAVPSPRKLAATGRKPLFIAGAVLFLLVAIAAGYLFFYPKTKQITSIAVMPFVNESGNIELEYLSDGMTETLIGSLSQLPGLDVKARSSVFRYKGKETKSEVVGKELKVQAILTGRLVQRGQDLTLYTELVDAQKETVLWSADYKQPVASLVSLQSNITRDVVQKLKARISGAEEQKVSKNYTANSDAYRHYLKGRYFWNQRTGEGLNKAIEEFQKAIGFDQNYALAYSGLADCYLLLRGWTGASSGEMYQRARAAALRALEIDHDLAEAHASMGLAHYHGWQWAEAESELKRSIELNPRYASAYQWYSLWLEVMGRKNEAFIQMRRAQELEPLSPIIGANVARQYATSGNAAAGIAECEKLIEVNPASGVAHQVLALALHVKGDNQKALQAAEKSVALTRRDGRPLGMLGFILGRAGRHAEALAIARELEQKYARQEARAVSVAIVYAGLDKKDETFAWLEKSFRQGSLLAHELMAEWYFHAMQQDTRYKALLKGMGLPH